MRLEDIPEIPDAGSTQSALANIPEVPDVPAVSGTKHPGLSTLLSQYGLSLQNEAKASAVPGQVLAGVVEPVTLAFPLSIAAGVAERIRRREGEWLPPIIGPGSNEAGESAVKTMRGAQERFSFVPSDPTAAYITEGINNVLGIPALVGGATLKDNREQVIEATKNYPGPMQTAIRILAEGAAQVGQPFRTSMKQYDSPFLSELLGIVPELAAYKGIGGGVSLARKGIGKIRDAVSLHGLENVLDSGQPMPAQAPVAPVKVTAAQARKARANAKGMTASGAEQLAFEGIKPGKKSAKLEDIPEVPPVNENQLDLFAPVKEEKSVTQKASVEEQPLPKLGDNVLVFRPKDTTDPYTKIRASLSEQTNIHPADIDIVEAVPKPADTSQFGNQMSSSLQSILKDWHEENRSIGQIPDPFGDGTVTDIRLKKGVPETHINYGMTIDRQSGKPRPNAQVVLFQPKYELEVFNSNRGWERIERIYSDAEAIEWLNKYNNLFSGHQKSGNIEQVSVATKSVVPTKVPKPDVKGMTQTLLRMGWQRKELRGMKPDEMQALIDKASKPPEADAATIARAQELAAQVDAQAKLGVNQRQAQKIVDDAQQKASAAVAVKDAPPEYLYHATNKEALRGIFEEGLDPLRSAEYEWGDSLGPRISLSADQGMVKDFGNVILRVNKNVLDSAELLDMTHRNNMPEQHYFKNIRPADIEVLTKDGDWISLRGQKKVVADGATSRQLLTQDEAIPPRPAELDAFEKEMQNEPVPKSAADLFAKDIDTPVEMPADQKAARMQLLRERMSAHQKQFDDGLQRRASQRKAIRGKKEKAEKVTIEEVDKTPEAAMDNMLDETSQAYWEQKLAEEGMPDDLPLSDTMKDDMVIDRDPFTTDRGRRELTFDMLGGQQLYENAVRLIADSPTVQNVCRLAKVAAMQGVKTLGEFRVKAKQVLGDLFDSVAQHLRSAWEAAKAWNNEVGAVVLNKKEPFYSKLEEVVTFKMRMNMPIDQLRKTMLNNGVTVDEFNTVLGHLKGNVTRKQVLDEIAVSKTRFEDVVLGAVSLDDIAMELYGKPYKELDSTLKHSVYFESSGRGPQFEQWSEPGYVPGSYREMLVTAPEILKEQRIKLGIDNDTYGKELLRYGNITREEFNRLFSGDHNQATTPGVPYNWRDGHGAYSDIQNPIVRIRFNERDVNGKKVLFVEEFQGPNPENQAKMPESLRSRIYDIGVKRVVSYAKENGFDEIAWTTGKMQADRYSLSTVIDNVSWKKYEDVKGDYRDVNVIPKDGQPIRLVVETATGKIIASNHNHLKLKQIDEVVGKDMSKKILSAPSAVLTGLDLEVGGDGLKRLYDETIPGLMEKYGKEKIGKQAIIKGKQEEVKTSYIPVTEKTPSSFTLYSGLDITKFPEVIRALGGNIKEAASLINDRRAKIAAQKQARQNAPSKDIIAQITGESGEHALLDNRPVSERRIVKLMRSIGDPLFRYAGTPHEKIILEAIDAQSIEGFNTANNKVALNAIEAGLSPAERVNIRQVLEGKPAVTPRAAERAQMARAWLDAMRVRYQDFLKGQIIKGLPENEGRIFKYIIETGDYLGSKQLEWQIYKETGKRTPYDRIIRKIKEYDEVDSWGIDDYVPKVELGTIVLKDAHGNIVAHASNQKDAIEKATRYWESAEKPTDLKMDLDPSLYQDLRASLPAKAYHSVAKKLSAAIQEQVAGLNKEAAQQLAYKAMKKEFSVNPPDVFSPYAEPRRDILRGEEDIIPVLHHYSRMMERKMAYDPVIADIRKTLNSSSKDIKIDKTLREDLEALVKDLKGNYTRQDRILDGALNELFKTANQYLGTDITAPAFSYTRALGQFRKGSANAKLGYRLVATGVNRLSGGLHTLTKTGVRTFAEGRKFLDTPEGKSLIKEVESRLGTMIIDEAADMRPTTELWKPLGTYQAIEVMNRTECIAANYLFGKKQGMTHEAAREFAVKQNKIQQFVYNVAALPGWMRGPLARTIFQFKPYLLKEMQFISTLRGAEWARYFTGVMLLGGPRAIMCTLKSLPIIGLMAGWDTLDEAMNKGPWISKISRGIPGLLGLDVSAASSPQFPMSPEDALGPSLSLLADIVTFAADMAKGIDVSGKDAAKIMTDYVIVANTVKEAIDLAIDGDGWVKNANGQRMYNVYDVSGTTAEQALDLGSYVLQRQVLGAKPLEMTQMQLADSITRKRDKVDEQNRSIAIRELGAYLVRGKNPPDDLWKHALELGTTADSIVQNVQYRLLDPRTRALLRAELRKKANVLESYPEPEESINPTDLALPGRRQRFLHNFGPAQKGDLQ